MVLFKHLGLPKPPLDFHPHKLRSSQVSTTYEMVNHTLARWVLGVAA